MPMGGGGVSLSYPLNKPQKHVRKESFHIFSQTQITHIFNTRLFIEILTQNLGLKFLRNKAKRQRGQEVKLICVKV